MRRIVATALVAAIALLALASAAQAAPPPKYKLDVIVDYVERSNLAGAGYPDDCKTWTNARSLVVFSARSARPVLMGLVRNPVNDSIWGLFPRGIEPSADVYRSWKYRVHVTPSTEACSPCGPSSEYGLCTGELPDQIASDECGGEGERRRGVIALMVSDAGISVTASPAADFSDCRDPRPGVIALGTGDPKVERLLLPDGTRQLQRMKPGQTRTLRRTIRRGPKCDRLLRGPGLRRCLQKKVLIRATRVS